MGLFRVRSKDRDAASDQRRVDAICSAVEAALADAEAELAGLLRRLKDDSDSAAFLFGDDLDSQSAGDALLSRKLQQKEQSIMRSEERRAELIRHIESLRSLRVGLESLTTRGAEGPLHDNSSSHAV